MSVLLRCNAVDYSVDRSSRPPPSESILTYDGILSSGLAGVGLAGVFLDGYHGRTTWHELKVEMLLDTSTVFWPCLPVCIYLGYSNTSFKVSDLRLLDNLQ